MNPSAIGPVKAAVLETDLAALTLEVDKFLAAAGRVSLRQQLTVFAKAHNIPL